MSRLLSLASLVLVPAAALAQQAPAKGPLRVHPENPRYFTDGTKTSRGGWRAVFLTGSHTWCNLVDMGRDDPPAAFDFDKYLDFLDRHGHNFIRLWAWDSTTWDTRANGSIGKDFIHHVGPLPWERTGPGEALDSKPRFDLTKFDPAYFQRLRSRVEAAGRRGIYVSVMLFEGWGLFHANRRRGTAESWAWRSHPFHPENNVNGLKGGEGEAAEKVHRLSDPALNALQAAYITKVVDTVNDLDNVLYEVINEGGEKEWDRWVVKTIKDRERSKPKQHPVGLTGHGAERLDSMLDSDADWVSPGRADGHGEDPPAWGRARKKVSILDTDHVWGVGGNAGWVWKSLLRGHNPIFMDPYDGAILGKPDDRGWEAVRRAMGDARRLAEGMDLARMDPSGDLASTGYCLALAGEEYLVYLPDGGKVTVDLPAARGDFTVEWHDSAGRKTVVAAPVPGGSPREIEAPFAGAALLHLEARR